MRSIIGKALAGKIKPHAGYLGLHLKMSVNERQKKKYEKGGKEKTPSLRLGPSRPAPRRRRATISPLFGADVFGGVATRHVEPLVGLEGVDGNDFVRHQATVQLAPRGPKAGLQVELVAVALLDGDLLAQNVSNEVRYEETYTTDGGWLPLTLQNWYQP